MPPMRSAAARRPHAECSIARAAATSTGARRNAARAPGWRATTGRTGASDSAVSAAWLLRRDLDEVAAGVVEHGGLDRAHLGRLLREAHSKPGQALELAVDVGHRERGEWDAVGHKRLL